MKKFLAVVTMSLFLCAQVHATEDTDPIAGEEAAEGAPSVEVIRELLASDVAAAMNTGTALAASPQELEFWAKQAKAAHKNLGPSQGDASKTYDVVIQSGHYPRTSGKTGGTGKYATEQEMAAFVTYAIRENLKGSNIDLLVIGADDFVSPLKTKIFLSLHTDGSEIPCNSGPSVGYRRSAEVAEYKGMHSIALALALSLDYQPEQFLRDNHTTNLSGYYAYGRVNASYFKGVLEMSEHSCKEQEERLLTNATKLAANLAVAIKFALREPNAK
jgi:hypothetical protein